MRPTRFLLPLIDGLALAVAGVLALWATLPEDWFERMAVTRTSGLWCDAFARRWDRGCLGWTRGLALAHLIGDLLHWSAYCTIAMVLYRLHPIRRNLPSWITVRLMSAFIFGCGIVHLFDAYCIVHPLYVALAAFKIANGWISLIATVAVAYSLSAAFRNLQISRARLERFEQLHPNMEL